MKAIGAKESKECRQLCPVTLYPFFWCTVSEHLPGASSDLPPQLPPTPHPSPTLASEALGRQMGQEDGASLQEAEWSQGAQAGDEKQMGCWGEAQTGRKGTAGKGHLSAPPPT